jgi:hypothetical protein
MPVDSFKFLPRLIAAIYQATDLQPELPIPWTPVSRPLSELKFGLVTSGGLYLIKDQPPFDLEREQAQPTWGDPTYRGIPTDIQQDELGVSHLHVNPQWVLEDIDVLLPIHRFKELAAEGRIGGLADHAYSFMGYQGYPPDTRVWQEVSGPRVAERLREKGVDCVLLTPS